MNGIDPRAMQPLEGVSQAGRTPMQKPKPTGGSNAFETVLRQQVEKTDLKFSRHAQERMRSRGIKLDAAQLEKLNSAVKKAKSKSAGEALVLMNDLSFVVSVKNSTVVTVMNRADRESVFTNIDSAVIV